MKLSCYDVIGRIDQDVTEFAICAFQSLAESDLDCYELIFLYCVSCDGVVSSVTVLTCVCVL